jgi:hypothetical protein
VDLRATHLTDVHLGGDGLATAWLPAGVLSCEVTTGAGVQAGALRVHAEEAGRWVRLTLTSPEPRIPDGLRGVRQVMLNVAGALTVTSLLDAPELEQLSVRWRKPPGTLNDAGALAQLRRLYTVDLHDAYGLDVPALPEPASWPMLQRFSVHGLRSSDAALLRARYGNRDVWLRVRGSKSDRWLEANLTNPFPDWVDDHEQAGAAACKAYAVASRAIDNLHVRPQDAAMDARTILRTLVERLTTIDAKHQIIDTVRREEAVEALIGLAGRAAIPADVAADWIDQWRDF